MRLTRLAAVSTLPLTLLLAGCGEDSTAVLPSTVASTTPAESSSPTPYTRPRYTPPPTPTPTPTPATLALGLGQPATVTERGSPAGEITVAAPQITTDPGSDFSDPPTNGYFAIFPVTARAISSTSFTINPFDFYYRTDDGTRYGYGDGSFFFDDAGLNHTTLNPGENVKGTLVFDVPAGAGEVVYAPGFHNRALGYWVVTVG